MPLPVPVLRRRRQAVVPALSALGGRVPRRAVQHCVLRVVDDDGGAGDRLQAWRLRPHLRRRASLSQSYRAGAAPNVAPAEASADHAHQSGCEGHLLVPLRRLRDRELRPASAHQGRGRGLTLSIRAARPDDTALIFALVCELADYENLQGEVDATPEEIARALFSPEPRLYCDIAEWDGAPAGFAVWFLNFSTFRGRHGLYLEDPFVRPEMRQRGIGTALMRRLAHHCVER